MTTAIRVEGVSKRYVLGRQFRRDRHLREALVESAGSVARAATRVFRRSGESGSSEHEFWALRDVSFEIAQGEAIGLIGGNGAGKSTLLKILSRITAPTNGRVELRGRVGSLLEVGTGFHPDLTGRENVYLNGAILGMRHSEIQNKFDEIVGFAEVEQFIDTPVKRYSSGMYLRLAFAVAAHLEPEVLLVDEVLAVGDAAFQKKCLGKMGEVTSAGRTVVFVSHNMSAVQSLCSRAVWLRGGRVEADGSARGVVSKYLNDSRAANAVRSWNLENAPGNQVFRLRFAAIQLGDSHARNSDGDITTRTPFKIVFEYWNLQPGIRLNLSLHVYNEYGTMIFNAVPGHTSELTGVPLKRGLYRDTCTIPGDLMNDGRYRIELLAVREDVEIVFKMDEVLTFEVRDDPFLRGAWFGKWAGAVRPVFQWKTELLESMDPQAK